jgi:hypothetical protein
MKETVDSFSVVLTGTALVCLAVALVTLLFSA